MDVTAESNSQFVAFRRFLYNISRQLTKEDADAIVYIHFYSQRDELKKASALDILCKLESSGIATSSRPEKLLELMKDLKRQDLVSAVKEFTKKKKPPSKKPVKEDGNIEDESEEDLMLRATIEAALVQATVLLQQMEVLQKSISGNKIQRQKIKLVVTEAAQTSEALAERLRRAEVKVNQNRDSYQSSDGSVVESGEFGTQRENNKGYINTSHTDRYTLSSSVPNLPGQYFQDSIAQRTNLRKVPEKEEEEAEEEEEEDEDDYEHMVPGVVSVDQIQSWEARRSIISNEYSFSRPHSKTTLESTRPDGLRHSEFLSSERQTPKTATDNDKVAPRRWINLKIPPNGEGGVGMAASVEQPVNWSTSEGRQGQKAASNKRMSLPVNNGVSKPGTKAVLLPKPAPKPTASTRYIPPQDRSNPTAPDDNYTTMHPTSRPNAQGSEDPNYYKHLNMDTVIQSAYTPIRRQ